MRPQAVIVILVVVLAIVLGIFYGCGKKEEPKPKAMVIREGVQYHFVNFWSAISKTKSGKKMPTYVVQFFYDPKTGEVSSPKDKDGALARADIAVPKLAIQRDQTLRKNFIVWDRPIKLEGRTYQTVRWNPRRMEPMAAKEEIREEEPPTQ